VAKEFTTNAGLNSEHFGNFLDACKQRDASILNADVREGHLSAAMSHLGNISYYLKEDNHVSTSELSDELSKIDSRDDNQATLERTVAHLEQNGVDLEKYPLSLGARLEFDPEKEVFTNSEEGNQMLSRDYRAPFRCPAPADV
jgi:hypothetical protein